MIEINHQYRFAGQVVIVRSSYVTEGGRTGFIIEHDDGSFSRANASSLTPIEPEELPTKAFPPVSATVSGFMRRPSKKKILFR